MYFNVKNSNFVRVHQILTETWLMSFKISNWIKICSSQIFEKLNYESVTWVELKMYSLTLTLIYLWIVILYLWWHYVTYRFQHPPTIHYTEITKVARCSWLIQWMCCMKLDLFIRKGVGRQTPSCKGWILI